MNTNIPGYLAEGDFRTRILDMERENTSLKRKVEELESALSEKEMSHTRLSKRMRSLEKSNNALQKATSMYEQERMELEREVTSAGANM